MTATSRFRVQQPLSLRVVQFLHPAHHYTGAAARSQHAHCCSSTVHAPQISQYPFKNSDARAFPPLLPTCHAASGHTVSHKIPTDLAEVTPK
ncbi:hypothetical protein PBY51_006759 [Eleginops maclovinus]|uniref:Uncharacterized protein n=1 Tax=Eleginops maclovinus TaxID=56733 RepID=A0AAN8AAJ4_ELEMC|nr:hypothetical protein PBY51_006759 [Eleginops maclovinus]